jgi:hypothetical protein
MGNRVAGAWLSAVLVSSPLVIGCGAQAGPEGTQNVPVAAAASPTAAASGSGLGAATAAGTRGVNGKLLYSITRSADHKIEFYELEHGETAAHESLLIGDRAELDAIKGPMMLADIYRFVEPSGTVPQAIVDADAHAVAFRATQPAASGKADSHGSATPAALKSAPAVGDEKAEAIAPLAVSCSPDETNDGWSGQWFLNTYCTAGSYRFCQQNWGSAYHNDQGSWFQWNQMEGDFNLNGHTTGYHEWYPCSWPWACGESYQTDWDYDVLPRHIEIWTYGDAGGSGSRRGTHGASGSSQCGHLHVAALNNN